MGARRGRTLLGAALLIAGVLVALLLATRNDDARTGRAIVDREVRPSTAVEEGREPRVPSEAFEGERSEAPAPDAAPEPAFVLPGVECVVHVPDGCHAADTTLKLDPPLPADLPVPGPGGGFLLRDVPAGRYRLEASHPACISAALAFEVAADREPPRPELFLRLGGSLRVAVRGPGAVPVAGQRIEVRWSGSVKVSGTPPLFSADTGDDGTVVFPRLRPGRYEVLRIDPERVHEAGAESQLRMASIEPENETVLVIEIGCRLEGFLAGPDGQPLAGAIVRMLPATWGPEGYRQESARTDEAGAFLIEGFAPGSYRITIQVLGRPSYVTTAATLEFAAGQTRAETIRIRATRLRGHIRLAVEEGAQASVLPRGSSLQVQARLVEVDAQGGIVRWRPEGGTAYADPEGRFELVGLEPGWYRLWFPGPAVDWADETRLVDFTAGGTLDGLDVELPARATATLVLRVLEADGGPATGVDFSISTGGQGSRTQVASRTGRGLWRLRVPIGEQVVFVHRPGFHARVQIDLAADEEQARDVKLQPTGR